MYLTDKKNNITHQTNEHEDLEVLLESFSKQVEEIVNEAQNIEVCMFVRCLGIIPTW
jgi:magnesium transporter